MCLYELYVSTLNKVGSGSGLSKLLGESHRRRIKKMEEKAKVFAAVWGGKNLFNSLPR